MEPLPEAIDADHLTQALRRCGALEHGRVSEVTVDVSTKTILSRIVRLRLTYDGAAANAPATMILKTSIPEREGPTWDGGRDEVAFYQKVASAIPGRFTPRCFDAQWDAQS